MPEGGRRLIGNINEGQALNPGGEAHARAALDFKGCKETALSDPPTSKAPPPPTPALAVVSVRIIARERARPHMSGRRRDQPDHIAGAIDGQIGSELLSVPT